MSLVLSEPHPDVDKVILSVRELQNIRAEYERLRSINAELLSALENIGRYTGNGPPTTPWQDIVRDIGQDARAAIVRVEPHAEGGSARTTC